MSEHTKCLVIQCFLHSPKEPYWKQRAAMIVAHKEGTNLKAAWILSRTVVFQWINTPVDNSFSDWVKLEDSGKGSDLTLLEVKD
jgi:hypothetical protein